MFGQAEPEAPAGLGLASGDDAFGNFRGVHDLDSELAVVRAELAKAKAEAKNKPNKN